MTHFDSFEKLCAETQPGRRLSPQILPAVDIVALFGNIRKVCEDETHPLRLAAKKSDVCAAVADLCPSETLAGTLDGVGVVCIVLAILLFEVDSTALAAREAGSVAPRDELELVMSSTDTNPIGGDPDSVQCALISYLRGDLMERSCAEFAIAAYGRAESYGTRVELAKTCTKFLHESEALLNDSNEHPVVEAAPVSAPRTVSRPASPSEKLSVPSIVLQRTDRATSPIQDFYNAAINPLASAAFAETPTVVTSAASPEEVSVATVVDEKGTFASEEKEVSTLTPSEPSSPEADEYRMPSETVAIEDVAEFDLVSALRGIATSFGTAEEMDELRRALDSL